MHYFTRSAVLALGAILFVIPAASHAATRISNADIEVDPNSVTSTLTYNATDPSKSYGTYTIKFDATAIRHTLYLPKQVVFAPSTGLFGQTLSLSTTTSFHGDKTAALTSTADRVGNYYVIREGDTETFTATASLDPSRSGYYGVGLTAVRYAASTTPPTGSINPRIWADPLYIPNESKAAVVTPTAAGSLMAAVSSADVTAIQSSITALLQKIQLLQSKFSAIPTLSSGGPSTGVGFSAMPNSGLAPLTTQFSANITAAIAKATDGEVIIDYGDGNQGIICKPGQSGVAGCTSLWTGQYTYANPGTYAAKIMATGNPTCNAYSPCVTAMTTVTVLPGNSSNSTSISSHPTAPLITSLSQNVSSGKDIDLVTVYGKNFLSQGKGGSLYVVFLQDGVTKKSLSSADQPMDVFAGVYLTPPDTNGTRIQFKLANSALPTGTYQVRVTTDTGTSNSVDFRVVNN